MSYEQQINQALARAYCTPENSSKELDAVLINAMTQEVLKSVGFIPREDSRPVAETIDQCGDCRHNWNNIHTKLYEHGMGWCYMFEEYHANCKQKRQIDGK